MKHIYLFSEMTKANIYGIGTYIHKLIKCISSSKDLNLSVIYMQMENEEFYLEKKSSNITYFYIPKIIQTKIKSTYYRDIFYLLYPFIDEKEENIYHFNYIEQIEILDYILLYFNRVKSCITIHFFNWSFILNGNQSLLKKNLEKGCNHIKNNNEIAALESFYDEANLLRKVDNIICLSEYAKDYLTQLYHIPAWKISLIRNGVEMNTPCLPNVDRIEMRNRMYFNKTDIIFLFVGRLNKAKGLDALIDAFSLLLEKQPKARLIVVGDGNISIYLKKCTFLLNRITFTGYLPKEDINFIYSITDIGVLPSFHEQCSFVAIEMMSQAIPIIYTDALGLNEMIDNGMKVNLTENVNGELSIDIHELSKKMYDLSKKKGFRKKIGLISKSTYLSKYTFCKMKYEYINFYNTY